MSEAVGFPAFPAGRRRPARTWWGRSWVQAVTDTALGQEPLRRGRLHAGAGRVGPITVSPGRITAQVSDVDEVHDTAVVVDPLGADEWSRFLDEVAGKAGHLAALLDRDMPRDLVEAAADAEVRLLPGIGDLRAECDCPDWELCQHAAAICFQVAWLLDGDPFVLLLLRGRERRELTEQLRIRAARSTTGAAPPAPEPAPAVPLLRVPPAPGVDPEAVARAAERAVRRARELLDRRRTDTDGDREERVPPPHGTPGRGLPVSTRPHTVEIGNTGNTGKNS
ncbi:SWIM zinc finger family protein [Actinophytocola xanthii]|uniref:SWIM zinc finger family protein n=1 Tax=Actinophytocola xanthii TaxID=1912961 RepID=UPI001177FD78|nr:hypothetical protein [Actinophytocola xanthii]